MKRRLLFVPLLAAVALAAQAPAARVTYTRSFKGSDPAFFQIEIGQDGAADFQVREHGADPVIRMPFTASAATVRLVFADAAALGEMARPLQAKDKVAYTGDKMLAYDDATQHHAQDYTYTKVPAASALTAVFEKIAVGGADAIRLRRAMQFDRLDVLQFVEQAQQDWSGHQIAEPQLLIPTLQALAADSNQMDAARHRAQRLIHSMTLAEAKAS